MFIAWCEARTLWFNAYVEVIPPAARWSPGWPNFKPMVAAWYVDVGLAVDLYNCYDTDDLNVFNGLKVRNLDVFFLSSFLQGPKCSAVFITYESVNLHFKLLRS